MLTDTVRKASSKCAGFRPEGPAPDPSLNFFTSLTTCAGVRVGASRAACGCSGSSPLGLAGCSSRRPSAESSLGET
jgi:hypothetical protein